MRDGSLLHGHLKTTKIPILIEYGLLEVDYHHLRSIDFRPADSELTKDSLELTDREKIRGLLQIKSLEIETGEKLQQISISDIRDLKVVREGVGASLGSLLLGLITLTAMEIVLGIDNIIFLAIVAGRLPREKQPRARKLGLIAALGTRILLLCSLSFLLGLTKPLFTLPELPFLADADAREISLRDLILLAGGLFLIGKSVMEMHESIEDENSATDEKKPLPRTVSFGKVLIQIAILDIVFSLDSVITAVGMVEELWVMIVAMIIAMFIMMTFAGKISDFVAKHPTLKILALSFLILIGVLLVAESVGQHIDKGYIYFAMAFAVCVEMINLKSGSREED
ncbi:TerC family protein [Telmatocola sphagniphila]|uniref:TerC family protein n=2 Tax=Telmatocola sphagniphila TaxID=1123043 RepID=A0A8E6BDP0_9BACT|nr:TerC family protein [Telmatocola sphagniphila]